MARPQIIKSEEFTKESSFRLQITKWREYQKDMDSFTWIKLWAARPTDSMLKEKLDVRGLFFEMLRFAASSRRPGWIVMGSDESMNVIELADIMRLSVEEIYEPIKRLIETKRIKLHKSLEIFENLTQNNSKQSEIILNNPSETDSTPLSESDSIPNNPIKNRIEEKRREKRTRAREIPPQFNPENSAAKVEQRIYGTQSAGHPANALTENGRIFYEYWNAAHEEYFDDKKYIWKNPDDYDSVEILVTGGQIEELLGYVFLFYAVHSRETPKRWPFEEGKEKYNIWAFTRVIQDYVTRCMGEKWEKALVSARDFIKDMKKNPPELPKR